MSEAKERVIFLKLSGERLGEKGLGWHGEGVEGTSKKLADAHESAEQIAIEGIVLVSGAGNIIRGERLKQDGIASRRADMLGRLGTVMNSIVVAEALTDKGVPTAVFIAKSMRFKDSDLDLERYEAGKLKKALQDGKVAIIAGGSGEDNATTDYAVAFYAGDYRQNFPDAEVVVLKGTKLDGVYEDDPAKAADVRRYRIIGAPMMQRDYERFSAVDERSLEEIIKHDLEMLVYADERHDLRTVLSHDFGGNANGEALGTLIVARDIQPTFY